jgi:nickel/cobalt transporter (NicO) family protein
VNNFQDLAQQGALHAWFYIPTAVVLGALHGLEPGHSKTMMAAFIIAIRGTVLQAVLLGLCAAFSHSLIIWLLAVAALHYGSQFNAESTEPYFQLASAVVILGLALWMAWRTHRDIKAEAGNHHAHHHDHGHDHHHDHDHAHSSVVGEYQDAHELAHATEIERRFANRKVTHGQIALFGLVLAFSAGLALTLVATGALAAWSLRHAERRFSGFGSVARKLPYLSSALLILMSLYIGIQGWIHLPPGR